MYSGQKYNVLLQLKCLIIKLISVAYWLNYLTYERKMCKLIFVNNALQLLCVFIIILKGKYVYGKLSYKA